MLRVRAVPALLLVPRGAPSGAGRCRVSERQPYSRVYWSIRSDERLATVYGNNDHLATWLRLLLAADMAWPAPADVPGSAGRRSLVALEAAGIIELLPGGLFRFHGLDGERGRRQESARLSAAYRTGTERRPNGDRSGTERLASRDETSLDEPSRAADDGRADLEAFLAVRFRAPTPNQRTFMDAYCRTFDVTGPDRAARLIFANPDDPIGAMKADIEAWRSERKAAAIASEPPKPARRKSSGLTGVNAELAAMFRDQEAKA